MATTFDPMHGKLTFSGLDEAVAVFRKRPDDCPLGPLLIGTAIPLQAWLQSWLRQDFKFVSFSEVFLGPLKAPSTTADVYIDKMAEGPTHRVVVDEIIRQIATYSIATGEITEDELCATRTPSSPQFSSCRPMATFACHDLSSKSTIGTSVFRERFCAQSTQP
ncbi:hypothetical protein SDRG_09347 [Saprolegnia diclina VS20]|uniref:Uncharacterized protein n=1 Tax=Saprolegnia diclina (strain VS20) TaxID=1156394 RepID=T0Q4P4_SAPDV|nr:hypothetical protein SDRG_09347 [Saprolegnia diclina VS20]EQC32809.1 hypothetical protein SDRG_09347 [Saprolegnia diclina VS20]|eukprot:XP_008613495.1 hypothetical protein SDRG_09347 [Saprolegnia diclina VS20]